MHNHQLEGRDITLSDMHACQIFLLGSPAALRLKNMRACQLVSGPVSGASFLDGALSRPAQQAMSSYDTCLSVAQALSQHSQSCMCLCPPLSKSQPMPWRGHRGPNCPNVQVYVPAPSG